MMVNGYLDHCTQKAFIPTVPGCIEHYTKLAAAIHEAQASHKSLTVCWLDLANAFGSVHHQLISFCLRHYNAPEQFVSLINHLYSGLFASICTKDWSTPAIPINIGVFQGDPLSAEIFNTVMNTYIDSVKPLLPNNSYKFSNSQHSLGLLQYADDTCLVSTGPASCRRMLLLTEKWLQWSGMRANVAKCQCVALEASSGHVVDPDLSLSGQKIPFIGHRPVKFLGGTVQIPADKQLARTHILNKVEALLSRVDASPVTRKQKLRLYRLGVCPRVTWDLTISDFPLSWIEKHLDPLVTKHLKCWSGLALPADPSRLFLPSSVGGLELPSISFLYQKLQVGRAALVTTTRDPTVQHSFHLQVQKENKAVRQKFKPACAVQRVFSEDPGATRKSLIRKVRQLAQHLEQEKRLSHATSLQVQGKLFDVTTKEAGVAWSCAIQSMSSPHLKFSLNAVQDTLPHNANLALWRKNAQVSDSCKLCNERQSLAHVLNCCPVALRSRRYNERHDNVLSTIVSFLRAHIDDDYQMIADLGTSSEYYFPPEIATTDLRPDLVLFSSQKREVVIIELTVCYELSFQKAQERKESKYFDLVEEAESNHYKADLITLQVGSRGIIDSNSFLPLRNYARVKPSVWKEFLRVIAATVIMGSFKIWVNRNHQP